MDTAAVSPAIGFLLEIAVKNVAICQPSVAAGGVRARNQADFGGFYARTAFTLNLQTVTGQAGPAPCQL
jgi:hypothetical protein